MIKLIEQIKTNKELINGFEEILNDMNKTLDDGIDHRYDILGLSYEFQNENDFYTVVTVFDVVQNKEVKIRLPKNYNILNELKIAVYLLGALSMVQSKTTQVFEESE